MNTIKKAFTLTEIITVIAIISVLMLWMTMYFWGSQERGKIIEAEWCATAFLWEVNSYVYNTLTSKAIKSWDQYIYPDYYYIQLTWNNGWNWVYNKILLWYSTNENNSFQLYKELTSSKVCQNSSKIWFYSGWKIKMNKWFLHKTLNDKVFQIWDAITWNIIVTYCTDSDCNWYKDIVKRDVDSRSQTISQKKCRFYNEDEANKCQTWED